jgi:hypothetical protein
MINIWKEYDVRLDFLNALCGSVPGNDKLIEPWLNAQAPKVKPPGGKSIAEIHEEVFATLPEQGEDTGEKKPARLVFQRIPLAGSEKRILALRSATFRAHMKDCARTVSSLYVGKIEGERSFSSRVLNGVYHDEVAEFTPITKADRSYFYEDDPAILNYDKPVHSKMPDGTPINALKNIEYVEGASVTFRIKVLQAKPKASASDAKQPKGSPTAKPAVSQEDLETLLSYGGVHGYGGERSDGKGRYKFTVTEVTNA